MAKSKDFRQASRLGDVGPDSVFGVWPGPGKAPGWEANVALQHSLY